MNNHGKKLAAPIAIAVLLVLYYIAFFVFILALDIPALVKLLMGIIPLAFAGCVIYVLVERIKEVRSGEEDDISKY